MYIHYIIKIKYNLLNLLLPNHYIINYNLLYLLMFNLYIYQLPIVRFFMRGAKRREVRPEGPKSERAKRVRSEARSAEREARRAEKRTSEASEKGRSLGSKI